MQKWEYLFIHQDFVNRSWETTCPSHPELQNAVKGKTEHEISNDVGEQGWELVSYTPFVGTPYGTSTQGLIGVRIVFKRPKNENKAASV